MNDINIGLKNYPGLSEALARVKKKVPCRCYVTDKGDHYDILLGDEMQKVGIMSKDRHSPDGYYSFIEICIEGQKFYEDIRRENVFKAVGFTAACAVMYIHNHGHFEIGEFDSEKYWRKK